ncbi:MAG: hypothetical protein WD030_08045 [Pirellulales bacterium]
MSTVTQEYVAGLPDIYRDIFLAYSSLDPSRRHGQGLAFQSLYAELDGKYGLGEIQSACEQMAAGGAVEIRNRIFAHPTELGEQIIEQLAGREAPRGSIPPFVPPG